MYAKHQRQLSIKVAAISLVAVTAICAALAAGTSAETMEDESGFHLGLKVIGSSLHQGDTSGEEFFIKDDGGGVLIDLGYRFNPTFMLELSVGGATHDTSDPAIDGRFETFHIVGYYRFSPEHAFRPYLKGGLAGYGLNIDGGSFSWRLKGGGVAVGGGFRYFFSPHFSIGLDLTHNIIQYENAEVDVGGFSYEWEIDEQGSATSLGLMFGYSF